MDVIFWLKILIFVVVEKFSILKLKEVNGGLKILYRFGFNRP